MQPSVQQPISKYKNVMGPGKKILFKKQLFDLKVKDQGPTKVIMVHDTPPYGHAPTYQISLTYLERQKCYGQTKKYYLKNNYLTLKSKVKVPQRSLRYATHRLMVMHPHTKYHWPISKDKKIKFKKQLFDLEVNVPRRSLRYMTPPYGHAPTYQISLTYLERQENKI